MALDNEAIFTCRHITEGGASILWVMRDAEGDLQALCGFVERHADAQPQILCWADLVAKDPTLVQCANLETGQQAWREAVGQPWTVGAIEDEAA